MPSKKGMWITAQEERLSKLRELRKALVIDLAENGYSYGDIGEVIRIDKGTAYRMVNSKKRLAGGYISKHLLESVSRNNLGRMIRNRVRIALKKNVKSGNTIELLGCSIADLKRHIESQFVVGMTWKNHGEWHIDHIRPLSSFDLSKPSQQKIACNFKNLKPLWAKENLKKGSKSVNAS